jgi:signal transduction histidine kinase
MPPTWERDVMATPRISTRSITWSVITKVKPRKPFEFQSVLLAIAGHDPRQPLQIIQGAHEFLGRGVRTTPERRQLRSSQSVIGRLRDQLNELVAVIQLRAHPKGQLRGGLGRAFAVALGRDVRMLGCGASPFSRSSARWRPDDTAQQRNCTWKRGR